MKFAEKLRGARMAAKLTQQQLASAIGVSLRTITNYETGDRYPKKREVYQKLADVLHLKRSYLVSEEEEFLNMEDVDNGSRGRKQAEQLIAGISGLFAGGELSDVDKDAVMEALQEAYWDAKRENRKNTQSEDK